MWSGCFLWLKNFVSAIDFCLFHLCRWAVVWPTGWLIYSYPDISIHIILIASTYSSLSILCSMIFFILHLYRIKIFFRGIYFYINFSCNKSSDNKLQLNDIILDCSRFCWIFQQIPNIQRDFLSLSEFASQQRPIKCWIYLSTWHF